VASNEDQTKFWRADYLGGERDANRYSFQVDGPVTEADFGRSKRFYLWEYGVGDTARQSTCVSLRRVEPNVFALEADVDVTLRLPAKGIEISGDKKTWTALSGKQEGAWYETRVTIRQAAAGPIFLRVQPN
jgi:hypothetical protein